MPCCCRCLYWSSIIRRQNNYINAYQKLERFTFVISVPVHSINTFLVFRLIFVWSPKTCENKNMLRNISFIAITLILILCQKDHCHLPQLKKTMIYCNNIHSCWQNSSSFHFLIYESNKRRKTDQTLWLGCALHCKTQESTGILAVSWKAN